MKSIKRHMIIAISVLWLAALAVLLIITKQETGQEATDSGVIEQSFIAQEVAVPDSVALDSILPSAKMPTLSIGGKENTDVYLQSFDIQVEVTGNIASTRYTMVFKNKTNKILEGELTFPLPDGRALTHYALDVNGRMRDAVPVEKARATQVFEEIQRRVIPIDPGVLERVEGNNFRTRIYPFPANGTRTISIGYEEELPLERGLLYYRLPMAYPDSLEKFAVKATVFKSIQKPLVPQSNDEIKFDSDGENYVAKLVREKYKPSRALIFALPAPADIPQVIMQPAQGSHYFLASVAPQMAIRKKQWSNNLAIIWDVSLSASQRNLQQEIKMLEMLFAEKKDANINLYFLNNRLKKATNKSWAEVKPLLETAIFDGGTDFSQINLKDIAGDEILFFSDGISTLSEADFVSNVTRPIHSIVSSSKADYSTMRLISGKTNGKFLNVNALSSEQLKDELLNETLQFLGTEHGKEIREVYPSIAMPVYGNFSVAGISGKDDAELTLLFGFGNNVEKRIKVQLDAKNAGASAGSATGNVYRIWAQKKIAELDLNFEKNREELIELGQQFGIVTRNTSLIVLETVADYVQYGIEPPATEPELRAEYYHRNPKRLQLQPESMLKEAISAAKNIKEWWNTDFTPKKPKYPVPDGETAVYDLMKDPNFVRDLDRVLSNIKGLQTSGRTELGGRRGSATGGFNDGYAEGGSGGIGDMLGGLMGGSSGAPQRKVEEISQPTIIIKPIRNDSEYLSKLTGTATKDYQLYLTLRNDYANSPTFYFDMSDWFHKLGDKETALRILTSIADLELENASLYKLLGYRFKEYGEYTLQKFVCQKIIKWRPMEPQSYRDYALALADNGETQAALDSLYGTLTRGYSSGIKNRSRGIEEAIVMEMNQLIAKNKKLNTTKIDKRLLMDIPVDVRVVINWNMDNTDIDLHVTDPNNAECSYKIEQTSIGGRISSDNTGGYGPEQFLLRNAISGKYKVQVNYYSAREFANAGPSTVMAEIYTKYADKSETRQVVSLQLSKAAKGNDSKATVAEFEF